MTGQLAFDLPLEPALGRDDFFVSDANRQAWAIMDHGARWPGGRMVLSGPQGSGKSHLAAIWVSVTGGRLVRATTLLDADLHDLAQSGTIAVDDADKVFGKPDLETALFHLCNLMAESKSNLLLTGTTLPRDWGMTLPDLASRVLASGFAQLAAPDDALLSAVLVKLFADRQIIVDPGLIPYLVARMDRSFATAQALIDQMDRTALGRGTSINRSLAAEILTNLTEKTE